MIAKLAEAEPDTKLYVLAQPKFAQAAADFVGARGEVVVGDVCDMDLGLSSAEYRALSRELTWIHHLAGIYFMGAADEMARRVNVGGTRTVLELARDATRLERVVHWSTAMVSGRSPGHVLRGGSRGGPEVPQRVRAHQVRRREADARRDAPAAITILRPSIIVGDSRTGEIDKLDGPYYLMVLIATNASGLRLPLLGRGDAPLPPRADRLRDRGRPPPRARGDRRGQDVPHRRSAADVGPRRVRGRGRARAHREAARSHPTPARTRRARHARLSRLGKGPLALVDVLGHTVHYDQSNTTTALTGSTLRCPPPRRLPRRARPPRPRCRAPARRHRGADRSAR